MYAQFIYPRFDFRNSYTFNSQASNLQARRQVRLADERLGLFAG